MRALCIEGTVRHAGVAAVRSMTAALALAVVDDWTLGAPPL